MSYSFVQFFSKVGSRDQMPRMLASNANQFRGTGFQPCNLSKRRLQHDFGC